MTYLYVQSNFTGFIWFSFQFLVLFFFYLKGILWPQTDLQPTAEQVNPGKLLDLSLVRETRPQDQGLFGHKAAASLMACKCLELAAFSKSLWRKASCRYWGPLKDLTKINKWNKKWKMERQEEVSKGTTISLTFWSFRVLSPPEKHVWNSEDIKLHSFVALHSGAVHARFLSTQPLSWNPDGQRAEECKSLLISGLAMFEWTGVSWFLDSFWN